MPNIELSFPGRSEAFSVRSFRVQQGISTPFRISLTVRSELDDADLDALAGSPAIFSVASPVSGRALRWTGICAHAELVHAEPSGLSTYAITLAPDLALLAHRTNCRVFRRMTAPEMAGAVLREWHIETELHLALDPGAHPVLDFQVQYNESDLAFVSRMLESAGVSYFFRTVDDQTRMVLSDRPGNAEVQGDSIPFHADTSSTAGTPYVTSLSRATHVRPGAYRVRDYDFQRPSFDLRGDAAPRDARLEHYDYAPGAALAMGRGADARGGASAEQGVLAAAAQRRLDAARVDHKLLGFETNVIDLAPGAVMTIAGHPRTDIAADTRLLVIGMTMEGNASGQYHGLAKAVFAEAPFRPPIVTRRPWIGGVQSATVVGPPGEEIHVDEAGRVRVLFPWDQEGARGEGSSCWVRVSQAWAGSGFGVVALPRVGDEVLIAFLDGDPDQPVVVGRLHNATHMHPYRLPEERATTGIKTQSTPGGRGYNELRFDDRAGSEIVVLRAQRNLDETVVADHTSSVGHDRRELVEGHHTASIGGDLHHSVGGNRREAVARDRTESTGGSLSVSVGGNHDEVVRGHRSIEVAGQSLLRLTGSATARVQAHAALSVGGSLSVDVGVTGAKAAAIHARGSCFVGSDEDVVVHAVRSVSLRCGESQIRLTPDGIELSAKAITLKGEDAILLRGDESLIELAAEASVASKATRLFGESSSLELTANASVKGTKIKLNHREGDPPKVSDEAAKPETRTLKLRLTNAAFEPFANRPYEMTAQGVRYTGTTDGSGRIAQDLPRTAEHVHVLLWEGDPPAGAHREWNFHFGEPAPATTLAGARSRLRTLGYRVGAGDELDPVTRRALLEFQEDHELEPTGAVDAATAGKLVEVHGH